MSREVSPDNPQNMWILRGFFMVLHPTLTPPATPDDWSVVGLGLVFLNKSSQEVFPNKTNACDYLATSVIEQLQPQPLLKLSRRY